MANCAVEAEMLTVQLGKKEIITDISFRVKYGELLAIIGPNGSGKTTLLRSLAGLLAHRGCVRFHGMNLAKMNLMARAQKVAYLPQHSQLEASMKARDVVGLARGVDRVTPGHARRDALAIAHALKQVGVEHLGEVPYCDLSFGEKRLVVLARALATDSRILLLDEPTAFLDIQHSLELHATIQALRGQGYCIIAVLHDVDEVWRYADRALLLKSGKIQALGAPSQGEFAQAVEHTYGVRLMPQFRLGAELLKQSE